MISPNTLAFKYWLAMFGNATATMTPTSNDEITVRIGGGSPDHHDKLDWSTGSYAVHTHAFANLFTPERWIEAISTGSRTTGSAGTVEPVEHSKVEMALVGAL